MRASTAVAILCLAAGVAPSVTLALPAFKFERANMRPQIHPAGPRTRPKALNEFNTQPDWPEIQQPRPQHPNSLSHVQSWQPPPTPPKSPNTPPKSSNRPQSTPNKLPSTRRPFSETPNTLLSPLPSPPPTPESQTKPQRLQPASSPFIVERELLEHVDQRIKHVARAYVRELLKASMDDLD